MPPSKQKKSRKPRRRAAKPRANPTQVSEWASLSETTSLNSPSGPSFNHDTMYSTLDTNLASYPRASAVAKAYQFYRIKNIRFIFKMPQDTFSGATNTGVKPQLYYMIDKSASIPNFATLATLKSMGARPKMFDEKNAIVNWKPSILVLAETLLGNTPSEYKISPWLSTEAATVNHLGIFWFSSVNGNLYTGSYYVDIEVQFEFKKPLWEAPSPQEGVERPVALRGAPV